jgi:alkylated DNA repair dioxygenase AlkB
MYYKDRFEILRQGHSSIHYIPGYVKEILSLDITKDDIIKDIKFNRIQYNYGGKSIYAPRLVAWYGDEGAVYKYSGHRNIPLPWTPLLKEIRDSLLRKTGGYYFNSVLLNLYRNEKDSVAWHSDDEPEIGPSDDNRAITSLSFGATRRFLIRNKTDKKEKYEFLLENGSLLMMLGETQSYYEHSIPKTTKSVGERLNLTFRIIK